EVLKILSDFEKKQKNSVYGPSAYLYYNSDFYIEIMISIGLFYLIKNFKNKEIYQLSDFKLGDIVYYKNKNYIFRGLGKGRNANKVELHSYKKEKKMLQTFIPIELFLNNSTKIMEPKRKQTSSIDKLVSTIFGVENPNNKVNYQVIILT